MCLKISHTRVRCVIKHKNTSSLLAKLEFKVNRILRQKLNCTHLLDTQYEGRRFTDDRSVVLRLVSLREFKRSAAAQNYNARAHERTETHSDHTHTPVHRKPTYKTFPYICLIKYQNWKLWGKSLDRRGLYFLEEGTQSVNTARACLYEKILSCWVSWRNTAAAFSTRETRSSWSF